MHPRGHSGSGFELQVPILKSVPNCVAYVYYSVSTKIALQSKWVKEIEC